MKYLFDCWQNVERQVKAAQRVFILSDYDGTLTPIVEKPCLATLSEEMKQLLRSVMKHPRYKFAIISGRSLDNLKKLVGIDGIYYAGNHGLEIEGPALHLVHPEAEQLQPVMFRVREELKSKIGSIAGVLFEDKKLSLSVHYRLVNQERVAEVRDAVEAVMAKYSRLRVLGGKKVFDILPRIPWNKGEAALWILRSLAEDALPVYFGDDRTDEDAFASLVKGITVLVSGRKRVSKAKYYVKNVIDVQNVLDRLLKIS